MSIEMDWQTAFEEAQKQLEAAQIEQVEVEEKPTTVTHVPIKGDPVRMLVNRKTDVLSDAAVDVRAFNALHIDVFVVGTTPSAVISIEGGPEKGGSFLPLPDSQAVQTITKSISFDVLCGSAFARVRMANVSGTGQAFTVIATPYVAAGQPEVSQSVAVLQKDKQGRASITCTLANTDYAAAAVIPAGTTHIIVWADAVAIVAVDEVTSATVGVAIPANNPQVFPVVFGAGDSKIHAQSADAGTVLNIAYLQD